MFNIARNGNLAQRCSSEGSTEATERRKPRCSPRPDVLDRSFVTLGQRLRQFQSKNCFILTSPDTATSTLQPTKFRQPGETMNALWKRRGSPCRPVVLTPS